MTRSFGIAAGAAIVFTFIACSKGPKPIPDYSAGEGIVVPEPENVYDFEKAHTEITAASDLVLIYGAGHHRNPYYWTESQLDSYVTYESPEGKKDWLFDGFLFFDYMDVGTGGSGTAFITGAMHNGKYLPSATKDTWEDMADYFFVEETGLDALENSIAKAAATMGDVGKRHVVIGIPEPIKYLNAVGNSGTGGTKYWGELNNKVMNFAVPQDRFDACKWYIDRIRENFSKKNYKYIDLTGFYWIAEKSTQTADLLPSIAKYLNGLKYSFNWIPYFNADGNTLWQRHGFNYAYLQPNYFFDENIPKSRLTDACKLAKQYNMDMELEFDGGASESYGKGYRLRDYMEVFKSEGIWESRKLAYYQSTQALIWLKNSSNEKDRQLYHEFCQFVVTRPTRNK